MASPTIMPAAVNPPTPPRDPPLLETGDHLSRDEFERRYNAMPELKKAELIEGVVYVSSAVRWRHHASPHAVLLAFLVSYWTDTPGVEAGGEGSIRLDMDNMPQPDAAMLIDPRRGGQAQISEDDYVESGPELVAEVAGSSVSIDLNIKFRVYRRNGVREYIVWRVNDRSIDWFILRGSQFERLAPGADGIYRSEVFPGLWLDAAALARFDLVTVRQVLQQGVASAEHAAFVAKLKQAAGNKA